MTSPNTPSGETGAASKASRPLPRGRILAALVLFFVALAGGLTAVVLDRFVLRPPPGPRFHDLGRGPGGRPPERERAARDHFAKELGLTPEQRVRIDSLMDRQLKEIRAVREQVRPRLDSIVGQTRREIDAILTPEQRKKAQELAQRRFGDRGEWKGGPDLGPPDAGPMGPPPPPHDGEPGPPR
jgi:Spy/CpxP family protein refolding chaperone